jgi:putative SOS response-associated peptidase YedK
MCGRFTLAEEIDVLQERFEFENTQIDFKPRYNIAPGQASPVVAMNGSRRLLMMRWGLIPSWAKEVSIGFKMINARVETLSEKSSFKRLFKEKRCLVLADGFYEWKKTEKTKTKIPVRFVLKSREPFAFAGLWDIWQSPEGHELCTFTIITTEANDIVKPYHDRMPVILEREAEGEWLNPKMSDIKSLSILLHPHLPELMDVYRVSSIVNSAQNDTPECIKKQELF